MHFWIDKRSSQLHQYGGGGRRGPPGAGGFYSQNFGTHRNTHHPPPSLGHPHRLRTRTSSTTNATTSTTATTSTSGGTSNNNPTMLSSSNNNNSQLPSHPNGTQSSSTAATIALQYPHQQPHQVQQQHAHAIIPSTGGMYGASGPGVNFVGLTGVGSGQTRLITTTGVVGRNSTFFTNSQQQPIFGGGILAISGSAGGVVNAAAMNPPMAIVAGDDESGTLSSTTVLTFPPSATSATATNPRGGIDLSWRNPYHVPGSSVSRCRAYSRDIISAATSSAASSRGTRGRRTSSSSSSGLGRNSLGTPGTIGGASIHSQNGTVETPEAMTDRGTRSERTSFDRDTVTPQRSLSLTSPDATEQSSRRNSSGGGPSLENDPGWACTKRVGLTLCFLAFILLGTVGAKFMIQGPGVIDTSRTGKAEAAAYFLFTELIFVAFAMFLFFTGVACLRKRTNDYLLRQFNQYILNTSGTPGVTGNTMGGIPGQDAYDFEYYDGAHPHGAGSPSSRGHHHHHHLHHGLHHGGFHHFRHHRSNGSLIEEGGEFGSAGDLSQNSHNFHGAGPYHYPAHYPGAGSHSSRHGRSKPPPYDIAILLPLPDPESLHGGSSPTQESSNINEIDKSKLTNSIDGIGFIDSSSVKDVQETAGGSNVFNGQNENGDSNPRNNGENSRGSSEEHDNRSETPPPPYEQI